MKKWLVRRYVLEEFEREAGTRAEALALVAKDGDPFLVTVTRETCVSRDWYNEHKAPAIWQYGDRDAEAEG